MIKNIDAEKALVAGALTDVAVFHEAGLRYSQFFDSLCQIAWKTIGILDSQGIVPDEISVADKAGLPLTELSKLTINMFGKVQNASYWANIVRSSYVERGLDLLASKKLNWTEKGYSSSEMLEACRKEIDKLESGVKADLPTLTDVATNQIIELQENTVSKKGLPCGLGIERVSPGGISRGVVTLLFAESGNFKTTVKNNIVLNIASAGHKVLDVSLEDSDELTAHRFIAGQSGLNYGKVHSGVLTGKERGMLKLSESAMKAGNNVIMAGNIEPNIGEIIRITRSVGDISAVVIDYVQLVKHTNYKLNEREVLNHVMREAQLAAKRDNIAYIIISQVKQDVDQRTDKRPRITDMLGSSAMRTAGKLSIGLYRPYLYHKVPAKGQGYENLYNNHPDGEKVYSQILELHFVKNVIGQPNVVVHARVDPGTGKMENFDMRNWV